MVKNPPANAGDRDVDLKLPWRRKWQLTPIFLLGTSHRQKEPGGYSPWGFKESDMTEHTHTHTHTQKLKFHKLVIVNQLPFLLPVAQKF